MSGSLTLASRAPKSCPTTSSSASGRAAICRRFPARYARPARVVVQHVLAYESIPQSLQDEVKNKLGIPGLIELVTLAGQYRLIAGMLFAFDSPLPERTPPPF